MKPESVDAMGDVAELSNEIHRLLQEGDTEQAHRLTTAANGLMLTVLCHELLDGELGLADSLFQGIARELTQ